MTGAPLLQGVGDALDGSGIGVAGGSDLDGGCTGQQELDRVFGCGDAPQAHDGDGDGTRGLVDHAHGDRLDRGTGKTAGVVGYPGATGLDVDRQRQEGVYQGERVRTGVFSAFCHLGNGGDVGRKLDDQGTSRNRLGPRDQLVEDAGVGTEDHSPVLGVGARGVQLIGSNAGGLCSAIRSLRCSRGSRSRRRWQCRQCRSGAGAEAAFSR